MKIKLQKVRWHFLLLSCGMFYLAFHTSFTPVNKEVLISIEIKVKDELYSGGSRSRCAFKFYASNYPCQFCIPKAGASVGDWSRLRTIGAGDVIMAQIKWVEKGNLHLSETRIPVYSVKKGNTLFYNSDTFNEAEKKRKNRAKILFYCLSFLFLINVIPKQTITF